VYVFTVPWDALVIPGLGGLTRLLGLVTFAVALLTVISERRIRRPGVIVGMAAAFTVWSALTLLWTISYGATVVSVWSCVQLFVSVCVIREFARTEREVRSLLVAFCVGTFVPIINLISNVGSITPAAKERFTTDGAIYLNANDLGLVFALTLPIAWFLQQRAGGVVRVIARLYLIVGPGALILTAARGALLAGVVGLSIIPLTARRSPVRSLALTTLVLGIPMLVIALLAPDALVDRLKSIDDEFRGGTLTGRTEIWKAGLQILPERPFVGIGTGAYPTAVAQTTSRPLVAHNALIGVLVERGVLGLLAFTMLLASCAWLIVRLPRGERAFWAVVMSSWLLGVMTVTWEQSKVTWTLIGFLASREGAHRARRFGREHVPAAEPAHSVGSHQGTLEPSSPAFLRR
jgi:O-antigen ligase